MDVDAADFAENNIRNICMKPYLVPLTSNKAKLSILAFPLSSSQLEDEHNHNKKAAFPGLEMAVFEVDLFPVVDKEIGKTWGCPIVPLFNLGGSEEDYPNLPKTVDIKAAISKNLRSAVLPTTKRDLRTLFSAWASIKESGPSKMKEKLPDMMWPLWTREEQSEQLGRKS